jgi:hypothetical protein
VRAVVERLATRLRGLGDSLRTDLRVLRSAQALTDARVAAMGARLALVADALTRQRGFLIARMEAGDRRLAAHVDSAYRLAVAGGGPTPTDPNGMLDGLCTTLTYAKDVAGLFGKQRLLGRLAGPLAAAELLARGVGDWQKAIAESPRPSRS